MTMDSINKHNNLYLSKKRLHHIDGVKNTAILLAKIYGEDVNKAELAALCHDSYKYLKGDELNNTINLLGLDKKYLNNNNLAHSKISAIMMKEKFGIKDADVLNAISFHTTGRPNMSKLEKIIYLADAIEPSRNYPQVDTLRDLAMIDLDDAVLTSLKRTIDYVSKQNEYLDKDTIDAEIYLEKQKEKLNG